MDDMEEYTVNDDLRACGLPVDDADDDLTAGAEALFGSNVARSMSMALMMPALVLEVMASATQMPTSTHTASTANNIVLKRARSGAWNNFEPIFETLPSGKQVRIAAKCRHCNHVLSGRSSSGTGHLLRH